MNIKKELITKLTTNNSDVFLKSNKKNVTYSKFFENVLKTITFLNKNYTKKKIIFINKNTEDFFVFFIACLFSNHIIFPIDPKTKKAKIIELKKKLKFDYIVNNFTLNKIKKERNGKLDFKDSDFLYILSSGTGTGDPKAILHTSKTLLKSSKSFSKVVSYNENTTVYHCMPTFYMAGILNTFLSCIFSKSKIAIGETANITNLDNFWKSTKELNVNSFHLAPSVFLAICIMYKPNQQLRDHLKNYQSLISTGSYLYPEIRKQFFKIFKRRLQTCWGLTELGGPITCESIEDVLYDENKFSVGKIPETFKVKITKNKNILIKSPFIMKGYVQKDNILEKPKLTKGFFGTGDMGNYKNKYLYYLGRNKEVIKIGGELVSLTIVENIAIKSKIVKESAAVGIKNIYSGEDLILFVVFKDKKFEKQIKKLNLFLKKNLRQIELPKKIIPILNIPKTKNGKMIKRKLIDTYLINNV